MLDVLSMLNELVGVTAVVGRPMALCETPWCIGSKAPLPVGEVVTILKHECFGCGLDMFYVAVNRTSDSGWVHGLCEVAAWHRISFAVAPSVLASTLRRLNPDNDVRNARPSLEDFLLVADSLVLAVGV
jgi:hypothetical protein